MSADDTTVAFIIDTQIAIFDDARHDLQLSLVEIAERAKLPVTTVNAWAQGRNTLSLWGVKKLLRVKELAPLLSRLFAPEEYALIGRDFHCLSRLYRREGTGAPSGQRGGQGHRTERVRDAAWEGRSAEAGGMSRPTTDRLKVNPPLGTLPVLQYCQPGQLLVDPTYQRSLENGTSQTLIRRIAQFWNWDLCQPLVVARRDGGCLYVVDGQHRLAAALLRRDIAQLPCVISSYANAADEAASFVQLNQQRRPLIALDLFRAAIASEDAEALSVQRKIKLAGLRLAPHMTAADCCATCMLCIYSQRSIGFRRH